jgi:hypothetical protein
VGSNGVLHPSFLNDKGSTLLLPDADATVQIWCKAVGYQGSPSVLTLMVPDGFWPPGSGGKGHLSSASTILPGPVTCGLGTLAL